MPKRTLDEDADTAKRSFLGDIYEDFQIGQKRIQAFFDRVPDPCDLKRETREGDFEDGRVGYKRDQPCERTFAEVAKMIFKRIHVMQSWSELVKRPIPLRTVLTPKRTRRDIFWSPVCRKLGVEPAPPTYEPKASVPKCERKRVIWAMECGCDLSGCAACELLDPRKRGCSIDWTFTDCPEPLEYLVKSALKTS